MRYIPEITRRGSLAISLSFSQKMSDRSVTAGHDLVAWQFLLHETSDLVPARSCSRDLVDEQGMKVLRETVRERDVNGLTTMQLYLLLMSNSASNGLNDDNNFNEEIERVLIFDRRDEETKLKEELNFVIQCACESNDLKLFKKAFKVHERISSEMHNDGIVSQSVLITSQHFLRALKHPHDESFALASAILKVDSSAIMNELLTSTDENGRNCLHLCAQFDSPKTMSLCLLMLERSNENVLKENDGIINARDSFQLKEDGFRTPLMTASSFSPDCALLLLSEKYRDYLDTSVRSKCGWTSLFYAIEQIFRDDDIDTENDIAKTSKVVRALIKIRNEKVEKNNGKNEHDDENDDDAIELNMQKNVFHLASMNARTPRALKLLCESSKLLEQLLWRADKTGDCALVDASKRGCDDNILFFIQEHKAAENHPKALKRAQDVYCSSKLAQIWIPSKLFRPWRSEDFLEIEREHVRDKSIAHYEKKLLLLHLLPETNKIDDFEEEREREQEVKQTL